MSTLRSSAAVSRRTALAGLGAGGLGVATVRRAAAQDATPASMTGHPLVGTWIHSRIPDDPTVMPIVLIFTADGILIDPGPGAAGVWEATGPRSAAWTSVGLNDEGYHIVRATGEVDEAGMTYTASASVTLVAPDGTVIATPPPLSPQGVRMQVEPEENAAMPLTNFPTWEPAPPEASPEA